MKFEKAKVSSLLGHTEIRYQSGKFNITASPMGIKLSGESEEFMDLKSLDSFAKVISDAWTEHLKLKPKIERPS